jgi:hypothetical protein
MHRFLVALLVLVISLAMLPGCGDSQPDPKENPKKGVGGRLPPKPGNP